MSNQHRKKIFAICGSTRKDSVNLHIIQHLTRFYPVFDWEIFTALATIPHFNPDLDKDPVPAPVKAFRDSIDSADGVLICTPEYVFSLPGSLKNAIEWTVSTTVFTNKPAALISASSQGEKGYQALNLLMNTLGARIGNASLLIQAPKTKVTVEGMVTDPKTAKDLEKMMQQFVTVLTLQDI